MITPKQTPNQKKTKQPNAEPSPELETPRVAAASPLSTTRDRLRRRALAEFREEVEDFCRYGSLSEVLLLTEALRISATNRDLTTTTTEDCPVADAMAVLAWG